MFFRTCRKIGYCPKVPLKAYILGFPRTNAMGTKVYFFVEGFFIGDDVYIIEGFAENALSKLKLKTGNRPEVYIESPIWEISSPIKDLSIWFKRIRKNIYDCF